MNLIKGVFGIFILALISFPFKAINGSAPEVNGSSTNIITEESIYEALHLENKGLDHEIFARAIEGHAKLKFGNKLKDSDIISIVDLSQPSTQKRLYIIDLKSRELIFNTYVSHGKNSGELFATSFSNTPSSLQSSLGFYITGDVYNGKHGISLLLHGQEPGFNDKALDRAIVVHGADYVSEGFIKNTGRLGRSFGCPAVATELATPIINTIRDGSVLFVYSPDPVYLKRSALANILN